MGSGKTIKIKSGIHSEDGTTIDFQYPADLPNERKNFQTQIVLFWVQKKTLKPNYKTISFEGRSKKVGQISGSVYSNV